MDTVIYLTDAIDHYLSKVAPNRLKPRTLKTAHSTLKMWRQALKPKTKLRDITTGKILTVRDNYDEPATANRVVSVLSSMMDACYEREWIDHNPCKRIKQLRVNNEDTGVLINPEWEAILKAEARKLDQGLYTLLCLAFETGARLGELEGLEPQHVDIFNRSLKFEKTKNGSDRIVPISIPTAALIEEFGLPGKLHRRRFNRVLKHLPQRVRFHDIRHTMISRTLDRGVPIAVVGKMVGHKTLAMTLRYQHVELEGLRHIVDAA